MLLLTFMVHGEPYALDVAGVIELVPRVELRAIPHAPAYLAGLLGYRGEVVPVIELGLLLGSSPGADRLSTRIILVKSTRDGQNRGGDARVLGLIAERVIDLVEVTADQVAPSPVHLARAPYLGAIARTDRGIVPLIEAAGLRRLLEPPDEPVGGPSPSPPSTDCE